MTVDRRTALGITSGAAIGLVLNNSLLAEDKATAKSKVVEGGCVLSLQLRGFPEDVLADEASAKKFLEPYMAVCASEMVNAHKLPKTRGCSVSGTVTGGSGGFGGSGTITCTF